MFRLLFLTVKKNFINVCKQITKIKMTLNTRHQSGARVNPQEKAPLPPTIICLLELEGKNNNPKMAISQKGADISQLSSLIVSKF